MTRHKKNQGGKTTQLTISVTPLQMSAIEAAMEFNGVGVSEAIRIFLDAGIEADPVPRAHDDFDLEQEVKNAAERNRIYEEMKAAGELG